MKRTAIAPDARPKSNSTHLTALERARKEQLDETKRWISINALKKLRQAWRH